MDIKIKLNDIWVDARPYQVEAFIGFKENNDYKYDYNNNGYIFSIQRVNNATYLIREDNIKIPIADFNDVKVFLLQGANTEWYPARNYQIFAYFDYIYSNDLIRKYKSRNTNVDAIEIPINGLESNIIFSMSRNPNGTIYYERNDAGRTRIRISDNNYYRRGYYGYYQRITDVSDFLPSAFVLSNNSYLPLPNNVIVRVTEDDEKVCIVCNTNEQNIRFSPCNHTTTCSECYVQLEHKRECPVCRGTIIKIDNYLI